MLRTLAKLLQVLNSETEPHQISLGLALGMVMGLTPVFTLHNVIVLLLVLVLRVNLSMFLVATALFSGLAYAADPWFHALGLAVLQYEPLVPAWTGLYNSAWGRLEHFNNTVVMGSLAVSAALFVPVILLANLLVARYRAHVPAWLKDNRIVTALKGSRFYEVYTSIARVTPP